MAIDKICFICLCCVLFFVGSASGKMSLDDDYWLLDRGNNTTCKIYNVGATIVSWKVNGVEQLFLSKNTVYSIVDPILGGIPVVFPIYGPWPINYYDGFARVLRWDWFTKPKILENGDIHISFVRRDTDYSLYYWPFEWRLYYHITLGEKSLTTYIKVWNPDLEYFQFQLAFHNYILVPEVTRCRIKGLRNATYYDKARPDLFPPPVTTPVYQEYRDVKISNWTERHYVQAGNELLITNVQEGKSMKITKTGFPDVVVYHTWNDHYKPMEEFADGEYRHYISVQPAVVEEFQPLHANHTFEASQVLELVDADYEFEFDYKKAIKNRD